MDREGNRSLKDKKREINRAYYTKNKNTDGYRGILYEELRNVNNCNLKLTYIVEHLNLKRLKPLKSEAVKKKDNENDSENDSESASENDSESDSENDSDHEDGKEEEENIIDY